MEVFIVGSGRSGTHWLARIFGRHPDFRTTVEKPSLIQKARRIAEGGPGASATSGGRDRSKRGHRQ